MLRAILLLVCLSVFGLVSSAEANHYSGYKWNNTVAQTLVLRDEMPAAWATAVQAKIDDWNLSSVIQITRVSGTCTGVEKICLRPFYCTTCLGGQTELVVKGHTIKYATSYINTYVYALPDNSVLCHEIGIALGLSYAPYGDPTCMTPGPTSEWPNEHDYAQLEAMY